VRSELIFRARETVDNKYKLCQTASKATRRLHIAAKNTTDSINDAFSRIAGGANFSLTANPILTSLVLSKATDGGRRAAKLPIVI
jgi:hypothetical protein